MITFFHLEGERLIQTEVVGQVGSVPEHTVWVDLLLPTREEEVSVESCLGIEVPTHDEMQEIETSSRLYVENGSLVMTMSVLNKPTGDGIDAAAITFILQSNRLLTVRYSDPLPFALFVQKIKKNSFLVPAGDQVFLGLLEQIADHLADTLENSTTDLEGVSRSIFQSKTRTEYAAVNYKEALYRIGHVGDLATKAKGSLLNLTRLLLFVAGQSDVNKEAKERMKTLMQDANSIDEHARFLSAKVGFLMDATLGLINLEQNNIIKMFSVAAVIFLPPTLIASIYGMNFKYMPELSWHNGYFFALILMALSAAIPLWLFWRKKWL